MTAPRKTPKNILNYLLRQVWGIDSSRDHLHCNPSNWIDEPAKRGAIQTTCKLCGGFIGSRPAKNDRPTKRRKRVGPKPLLDAS